MPWYACIAIIAVVWGVSLVHSRALKAFIYSLPIPMTLVMATTHSAVNADQLIGVVALVLFFFVLAAAKQRFGWRTLPSVVAAVAFYLLVALVVRLLPAADFVVTLVVVTVVWAVVAVLTFRSGLPGRDDATPETRPVREQLVRLGVLSVATFSIVFLGRFLGGLAVTFPYSGTLVAFDLGKDALAFARHFAFSSISLVAFFAAYWFAQDTSAFWFALLLAWIAFFVVSGAVAILRRLVPARQTARVG